MTQDVLFAPGTAGKEVPVQVRVRCHRDDADYIREMVARLLADGTLDAQAKEVGAAIATYGPGKAEDIARRWAYAGGASDGERDPVTLYHRIGRRLTDLGARVERTRVKGQRAATLRMAGTWGPREE
jgi:hypothetical protein